MNYKIAPTYYTRLLRVQANVSTGETLLNAGCGTGEYNYYLRGKFRQSYGVDVNEEDIATAQALNQDCDTHFTIGDITSLAFADGMFDSIICVDVLEHVENPADVLQELRRVLKPGGELIASVPHRNYPFFYDPINFLAERCLGKHFPIGIWGFGHTVLFDREMLRELLDNAGFSVVRTELLTHGFCGFLECYIPTLLRPIFTSNTSNSKTVSAKRSRERFWHFDHRIPRLFSSVLEALINIDYRFGKSSPRSVGVLMRAVKPDLGPD